MHFARLGRVCAVSPKRVSNKRQYTRFVRLGEAVLHLLGYDDHASKARRKMKRAEDALVRSLGRHFDFRRLGN
jgi:ssRNA-specific RNase YbeY (16S rRNA maturation enzyme)